RPAPRSAATGSGPPGGPCRRSSSKWPMAASTWPSRISVPARARVALCAARVPGCVVRTPSSAVRAAWSRSCAVLKGGGSAGAPGGRSAASGRESVPIAVPIASRAFASRLSDIIRSAAAPNQATARATTSPTTSPFRLEIHARTSSPARWNASGARSSCLLIRSCATSCLSSGVARKGAHCREGSASSSTTGRTLPGDPLGPARLLPEEQLEGHAQSKGVPELVGEVAPVRLGHRRRAVGGEGEGRRGRAPLRRVIEAERTSFHDGRRMGVHHPGEELVQGRSGHPEVELLVELGGDVEHLLHPLAALRGGKEDRGVGGEIESPFEVLA